LSFANGATLRFGDLKNENYLQKENNLRNQEKPKIKKV